MYLVSVEIKSKHERLQRDMSFTDGAGKLHENMHIHEMRRYTMQSNYLSALIAVLEALQNPAC